MNENVNKYPFFATIWQFVLLVLEIFGIRLDDPEDICWTSDLTPDENDDLIERTSNAAEHEDPPNDSDTDSENGFEMPDMDRVMDADLICPADEETPGISPGVSEERRLSTEGKLAEDCAGRQTESPLPVDAEVLPINPQQESTGRTETVFQCSEPTSNRYYGKKIEMRDPADEENRRISPGVSKERRLSTEVKPAEDCASRQTESPPPDAAAHLADFAGKREVRDGHAEGQDRRTSAADRHRQGVNMESASCKENLNDLGKDFEFSNRTKGSKPNVPADKNESNWADSVDEEDCPVTGVGPFMCHLFEKQLYTDVTFYFKESKTFFSAHRMVLAARCEFFEKLLFGQQMHDAVDMEMHVPINDVPLSTFTSVIKYLYTDAVEWADDSDVLETYRVARTYRIRGLVDRCKAYINEMELTENSVCSTLQLCQDKDVRSLTRRCVRFIQKNASRVIRSKDFEMCSYTTIRDICRLDDLQLGSEVELLEAVLRWTDVQKAPKQAKADWRRGLLKHVRLLRLTPKEFSEVLLRHPNLLTTEEGLKILMALNNPSVESLDSLPKWCNRQLVRRSFSEKQTSVPNSAGQGDRRTIDVRLKAAERRPSPGALTCLLHLKCLDGTQRIKSVTFCLESFAGKKCAFDVTVVVTPGGPTFHLTHWTKSKISVLTFDQPVAVHSGQTFEMKATAESGHQLCEFLQFDKWYCSRLDFMCFFISEPMTGKLYFISTIEYESV